MPEDPGAEGSTAGSNHREGYGASGCIGELSSVGSEHLPYKQGVTGSNPVVPTENQKVAESKFRLFFFRKTFRKTFRTSPPPKRLGAEAPVTRNPDY